jgi:hypothetical protein
MPATQKMTEAEHDAVMLRRAAAACRTFRNDHVVDPDCWIDWVPEWLERFAARIESEGVGRG